MQRRQGEDGPEGLPALTASGGRKPGFRLLFLRFLVPLLCVAGLLVLLGIIYQYSSTLPPVETSEIPEMPGAPVNDDLKNEYMAMVARGIERLKGFSGAKYRGSEEAVAVELDVFQAWAVTIKGMENYTLTPDEIQQVRALARQVSDIQKREFPAMRAEFAKAVGQSRRKLGIFASTTGDRHENLHVTCLPRSGEEGIGRALELLDHETVAQLRFVKTHFTFTQERTVTATLKPSRVPPPGDGRLAFWRGKEYELVEW
jgi:hypothetical protein